LTLEVSTVLTELGLIVGIVVSPAALESSCLMLAHGLDLMLTRVQPSKSFDLIPDDFPYGLLIATYLPWLLAQLCCV
jgi:hypothetical protein